MPKKSPTAMVNRRLSRLSARDFALLARNLSAVDLPIRKRLENRNKQIDKSTSWKAGSRLWLARVPVEASKWE
jgi:hypothetical protein